MNLFDFAQAEAERQGIDPSLVLRVLQTESGGRAGAVSPKGATGPMQLMPGTAKDLGVNINDPLDNIRGGVRYLAQQLKSFGSPDLALAAYNAGPGNVRKYGGVPPFQETQNYVGKIMGQQAPQDDSDIFGSAAKSAKANASPQDDTDIFADAKRPAASTQVLTQAAPVQQAPAQGIVAKLKDSPLGGLIRGIRDPIDAGAQLLSRGMVAIAPAGSSFENWAKNEQANVDKINNEAERAYQQDWRRGQMQGIDAGRIAGNVAATAPLAGVGGLAPTTLGGAMRLGAVTGALQPVDTSRPDVDFASEKLGQTALGTVFGGLGYGGGKVATKILKPTSSVMSAGQQAGADAAERLGVKLTPGQQTGSMGLQQVEAVLARTPGASGNMAAFQQANQAALNRAGAAAIGETGDILSESVLAAARQRLGTDFKNLSSGAKVALGDDFLNSLGKIDSMNRGLGSFANTQIDDLVNKGLDLAAKGNLDGKAYQTLRSRLTDRAGDAFRAGNSEMGQALKTLREGLDEAARSGMDDATKVAWDTVRRQYANLKVLTKGNVVQAGNINPTQVGSALRQYGGDMYKTGALQGPLMDVARVGEAFKQVVPNSGTAERTAIHNMIFGNPLTGLPAIGGANVMQRMMFSPMGQRYLTNGLLPMTPNLAPVGGLLGGPMVGQYQR
jgi:hypothetical protein